MKKYFWLPIVITGILIACHKELGLKQSASTKTPSDSLSLSTVQNWFNSSKNLQTANVNPGFDVHRLVFDWKKAGEITDQQRNWWIVALPGQPTYRGAKQGYRKLAFVRDTTGALEAHILEIIPDAAYLRQHGKADTKTFTGLVFVYDEHYQLLYGRVYNQGHRVGTIRPQTASPAGNGKAVNSLLKTDAVLLEDCEWVNDNYIDSNNEVNIYAYQICESDNWDGTFYPDGGGGIGGVPQGDPLGGGGGGGGTEDTAPPIADLPGFNGDAINAKAFMNCFNSLPDAGATETITVYVVEPQPGLPFNYGTNSVGHTAIGLTKSNNGQTITQTVGFYPTDRKTAYTDGPGQLIDNGGLPYTVSISYSVLPFEFNAIANFIANPPTIYNLYNYNCTNFVYDACLAGNIILPNPVGNMGMFQSGKTPAALGASISTVAPDMKVNNNGGSVGQSHGACN